MNRVKRTVRIPFLIALGILTFFCGIELFFFYSLQSVPIFESAAYDYRVRFAFRHSSSVATNLAAVIMDDESFALLRQKHGLGGPWSREYYGRVANALSAAGAKAITLDIRFRDSIEPERTDILADDGKSMTQEEFFSRQLAAAGNVVLATHDMDRPGKLIPIDLFRTNAWALGNNLSLVDLGIARAVRPYQDDPAYGRIWNQGIAVAARAMSLDLSRAVIEPHRIILRGPNSLERVIPLENGFFYINWALAWDDPRLTRASFAEVAGLKPATHQPGIWRDKIVFVHSLARAEKHRDWIATPLHTASMKNDKGQNIGDADTPLEARLPYLATRNLNVANSLLTGQFIHKAGITISLLCILGMGTLAATLIYHFGGMGTLCAIASVPVYYGFSLLLFDQFRYWIPVFMPVTCTGVMVYATGQLKRPDPMTLARKFFSRAGFKKIESLSSNHLLRLHPKQKQTPGLAVLWKEHTNLLPPRLMDAIQKVTRKTEGEFKVYLIYQGQGPGTKTVHDLKEKIGCEIIPLLGTMLEKGLSDHNCEAQLHQLEEPYLVRPDPYAEFKPIADPTWFYGRDELVQRLPAALAQGQHVGIFGLRKVGKTSLTNQLRQRFVTTPSVFLDCQALPAKAESFFDAIYQGLHASLRSQKIRPGRRGPPIRDAEDFSRRTLALYERWQKSGQTAPFIIFLDEIDKFFPAPGVNEREEILAEYVKVFRVLRGLAQTRQCLVTCAIAYRPAINRQNLLTSRAGENPMFNSFQEVFLGFLSPSDSEAMIREIGLWKNIVWEQRAARKVFEYCGGHPLITRFFASQACRRGALKQIDENRVIETAGEIETTLRKNEIGNYYKEAVGDLLLPEEHHVLKCITLAGNNGCAEKDLPSEFEEAVSNLENFGLLANSTGRLHASAQFFLAWLERRYKP